MTGRSSASRLGTLTSESSSCRTSFRSAVASRACSALRASENGKAPPGTQKTCDEDSVSGIREPVGPGQTQDAGDDVDSQSCGELEVI